MSIVTDVFLPLALAFIMFALGLGLSGSDFLRVIKQPRDFFVGALSQIILLPVIAFLLVKIWPISPELAIGVMIIAAAPGGVTSNIDRVCKRRCSSFNISNGNYKPTICSNHTFYSFCHFGFVWLS